MKMDLDLFDYNDSVYYTIVEYFSPTKASQFLDNLDIPYFVIKLSIGYMYIISHYYIHKLPQSDMSSSVRWDMARYIPIEWSKAFVFSMSIDLKQLLADWKIDLKDPSFRG